MHKNVKTIFSRAFILLITVSVIVGVIFAFSSCSQAPISKEELLANIDATSSEDVRDFDYVLQYFDLWDMPNHDVRKLSWAELSFKQYYNFGDGLPETGEHARLAANYFIENLYDSTDLDDKNAVTDALITSYVAVVGDAYAIYRRAEEYAVYNDDINGSFGGIGVVVEYNYQDETIMVSSVNLGSPAESAGFKPGDFVVAVDGRSIEELGYLNAVYHIRGKIGTSVTVTVLRGEERIDLTCTRALVEEISVAYEIDGDYGYIIVNGFKANTYKQFVEAVDYMVAEGVSGIVFDMRNNPGGLVDSVCDIISYLVPSGRTIISYDLKGDSSDITLKSQEDTHPKTGEKLDSVVDLPFVVICNEYTASAAEIFTAAMRDYRDDGLLEATIVGTTTYKKGIMQRTHPYDKDDSSLTFTIAYYNPPCGENYHGIGITPDINVLNTEAEDVQYSTAIKELEKLVNTN